MPELSRDNSGGLEVLSELRSPPADVALVRSLFRTTEGWYRDMVTATMRSGALVQGRGNSMTLQIARRAAVALVAGGMLAVAGAGAAMAQDSLGSVVTIGGGITGVQGGTSTILAPGVTINGGDVGNSTDIGVLSGGGSSIGASTGGDDSLAASE